MNFKKILCAVLACIMLLGIMPVMAEELLIAPAPAEDTVFYTDVFEGNPTYLMDDPFQGSNGQSPDGKVRPSGWDVDYRGGNIAKIGRGLAFYDTNEIENLSMTKKLLPHKEGKITLETAFKLVDVNNSIVTLDYSGAGKLAARFEIDDENVYLVQPDGKVVVGQNAADKDFTLKAIFDMDVKKIEIYAYGKFVGEYAFTEDCAVLEQVKVATGETGTSTFELRFMLLYINYLVNERFMTASGEALPDGWKETQGAGMASIYKINSGNIDDQNSIKIEDKPKKWLVK